MLPNYIIFDIFIDVQIEENTDFIISFDDIANIKRSYFCQILNGIPTLRYVEIGLLYNKYIWCNDTFYIDELSVLRYSTSDAGYVVIYNDNTFHINENEKTVMNDILTCFQDINVLITTEYKSFTTIASIYVYEYIPKN